MASLNLWHWVLLTVTLFAIVLPLLLATAMIWFGPRHDRPRRARRRPIEVGPSAPGLSLLSGITGDGS
ncbi:MULTISPECIES: hypothetical protein [unclassified Xanthomonas]|uniref:hypothetical protein n=1 Tax=unclassified Xanthomonas TaxID=2643310 RepID=UPI00160B8A05|nr:MULTISPECIES: hypothetical protein [unclassified Xanthomonas]MBB4131748.1 hypothetical protein [Xanthomonas sp. 3075]MBB5866487.1 hypothetical protein [Xanthomonas sp. 3058]